MPLASGTSVTSPTRQRRRLAIRTTRRSGCTARRRGARTASVRTPCTSLAAAPHSRTTLAGGWDAQTGFIDDRVKLPDTARASGLPLESTYWAPPPDNLQGWIAMPNGFLIAFDKPTPGGGGGNNVYMCEAYHFHAWP